MTSLFSLTGGEVLKSELRQLEPARISGHQAMRARAQNGRRANEYLYDRFQSYALATSWYGNCVAGNEAPR